MNQERTIYVAIADDHERFRTALRAHIERTGIIIVAEAGNGDELLKALSGCKHLPDICVVDIHMPVMDGFETVRALRDQWPDIGILTMSINSQASAIEQILEAGADKFIEKGADPELIEAALTDIYRSKNKAGA